MNPASSMRHCIMMGYDDAFGEKAAMFSEHLRDGDMINDSYMHDAARFNNTFALKLLLDKECIDPSRQNVGGNTPLHIAAYKGNCQCVAMLLESKSDPSAQNERGEVPLHRAVISEQLETLKLLLPVSDVDSLTTGGMGVLHFAARLGNLDMMRLLVEHGADINILAAKNRSVLHFSAMSGNLPSIAYVIRCGTLPKVVDSYNRTPRQTAFIPAALEFLHQCEEVSEDESALAELCDAQLH